MKADYWWHWDDKDSITVREKNKKPLLYDSKGKPPSHDHKIGFVKKKV